MASLKTRRVSLASCLILATVVAQAPADIVEKIKLEGSPEKSRVMDHLHHLCIEIGPRLTGSQRLVRACEWANETFKSYGLESRLDLWRTVEVGFDRGVHSGFAFYSEGPPVDATDQRPNPRRQTREQGRRLSFNTAAWTPGTGGLKHGPVLMIPKGAEGLAAMKDKAKGAWLLRGRENPSAKDLDAFILESGAHGVLSGGDELLRTGGSIRTTREALPKIVRISLVGVDYKFILEKLEGGVEVSCGFDIQNYFSEKPVPAFNVIAELKGTEKPDEIVIVGGHIDSWDGAQGTTDNGTGTSTTIEAARILTAVGAKPKRTIRFMLWSGEEQGLLGSGSYVERHSDENERISAVLVHDGGTNYASGISATEAMKAAMTDVFAPVTTLNPDMPFVVRDVRRLPMGIGSDHDSYLRVGVPGFFWNQSGKANYSYTHHTQNDVLAAAIPEYQRHTAMVVAIGALGIANLPELLSRTAPAADSRDAPNPLSAPRRLRVAFDEAMTITEAEEGGRGAVAGLKVGDVVLAVNGREVKDRNSLSAELNAGEPKKSVTVRRGKENLTVEIVFPR